MPARKGLLKSVSIDEMLYMREQGMSNQEIAESLEVTAPTIYHYIGRNPKNMPRRHKMIEESSAPRTVQQEEVIPACLLMENRKINLIGQTHEYEVNEKDMSVRIKRTGDMPFVMKIEDLDDFISELQAIKRHVNKPMTMEAW